MAANVLTESFYQQSDVLYLSEQLLGKYLCTHIDGVLTSGMIVETEAYRAPDDKASHAYGNRRTQRTETMFGPGGVAYVYLCYGIHHLFNVVTGVEDQAHAVLIRAVEPVEGLEVMLARRKLEKVKPALTNGPGKLSQALGITIDYNGFRLFRQEFIWIEDRNARIGANQIIRSPRIGVDYAEECAAWDWRFTIKDNRWCSA